MTLDVRINGQSLRDILSDAPVIRDDLNAACRSLEVNVFAAEGLLNYIGQKIELWYGGTCWFEGTVRRRGFDSEGNIRYTAHDPLINFKRNPDDYTFKNATATQIIKSLAATTGVKVYSLANTGAVFTKQLFYKGSDPDRIATDVLVRTFHANKKKFWYRYESNRGLRLFERVVPKEIWAFQVGVNLTYAQYEESIEETATVVKLVNRDTGKTVVRVDGEALKAYGHMQHFEEVDKENAPHMETKAADLLKKLSQVKVTSSLEGINPNRSMSQLYSGDVIYVEEEYTGLIGAYHIVNVAQVFTSDNLVHLAFDVQEAPEVPELEYPDATTNPAAKAKAAKTKGKAKGKKAPKKKVEKNPQYSAELKKIMDKYGVK